MNNASNSDTIMALVVAANYLVEHRNMVGDAALLDQVIDKVTNKYDSMADKLDDVYVWDWFIRMVDTHVQ